MTNPYLATFLAVLLLLSSCTAPVTPVQNSANPAIEATASPDTLLNEDPSFVSTQDTISAQGPQSITRSIMRDRSGKLWLASWQGTLCFDGQSFTNVTLKEGMKHFHTFSLLEDKSGKIWMGSIKGGVFCYDPALHTSRQFTTADGLSGNVVLSLLEDNRDNIWLGTTTGLSRYKSLESGPPAFTNYTTLEGLNNNSVNAILQDKSGKLWFGTNGGLCYYDPNPSVWSGAKAFQNFPDQNGKPFNNVRALIEDRDGHLWIGCQDGLWQYDTAKRSFTKIGSQFFGCIFEDRAGNIWVSEEVRSGAYMSLSRYNGKTFTRFAQSAQVFGITEDRQGNIWFGTERGTGRIDHSALGGPGLPDKLQR